MHSAPALALNPADSAAAPVPRPRQRWHLAVSSLAALLVLAGCAAPPRTEPAPVVAPTPAPVAPAAAPAPPPAPPPTLAQEQRRLSELFRGTPVVFSIDRDGSFRSEVPLKHSFEPGKAVVKPALGAVLDRLAASPATGGNLSWTVAGPSDPKATGFALAMERAASVRDYLGGKGVAASRVSISALGSGPQEPVLRVVVTPPGGTAAAPAEAAASAATPAAAARADATKKAAAAKPQTAKKAAAPKPAAAAKKPVPAKKPAPAKPVAPAKPKPPATPSAP